MSQRWDKYLKSNMDRFIEKLKFCIDKWFLNLKSNMDRFIAFTDTKRTA